MNTTTITGQEAALYWGYLQAARLQSWSITIDTSGCAMTAKVVSTDDFRASQPFLKFKVIRQNGTTWVWPVLSLQIDGGAISARLGHQE